MRIKNNVFYAARSKFVVVCMAIFLSFFAAVAASGIAIAAAPQIAGGGYHSLAMESDGTVWAWGSND